MQLTDFRVLTFDCYGTLIDWESGILAGLAPLTAQLAQPKTRDEILETHAYYESTQQRQTPAKNYQQLLAIVYRRIAEEWNIKVDWQECVHYGQSVKQWNAFDDSAEALRYLKQYFKLVVLSNVDNDSFAASNEKLGIEFDAIYTAEDIGSYKPAAANFDYMLTALERLGVEKSTVLHTAESMFHDHLPANQHGLKSCWIYRRHEKEGFGATMQPKQMPQYDFCYTSMAEMVQAHKDCLRGE
ncbi:MAG: haloacid dehalogenase type II [Proteobacteria bacterium]|nr:haloacid dehalogenase type II [Pseudomonadota bacterium]